MSTGSTPAHPNGSLYCDLMEFIKWRIELVRKTVYLVKTKQHYLDNRSAAEFCLLQLRFCCELLAIGCIAIHTDVPQNKRLQREWNAHEIMKAFEKLKPKFFPAPVRNVKVADGVYQHESVDGALTKAAFLRMYHFFGGLLHTGSYEGYKDPTQRSYDFQLIEDFVDQLVKLLNDHTFLLDGQRRMIRVLMNNAEDGRVWLNELIARPITQSNARD